VLLGRNLALRRQIDMVRTFRLTWPGPDPVPHGTARLRASDADRDQAADVLSTAVADGRLTTAELGERLEDVLTARTVSELAMLTADLAADRWSVLRALQAVGQEA
jgi:hypothetical protein